MSGRDLQLWKKQLRYCAVRTRAAVVIVEIRGGCAVLLSNLSLESQAHCIGTMKAGRFFLLVQPLQMLRSPEWYSIYFAT